MEYACNLGNSIKQLLLILCCACSAIDGTVPLAIVLSILILNPLHPGFAFLG